MTNGTDIYSNSKCVYCNNECYNICLDCKKFVCKKCENEHIPEKKIETVIYSFHSKKNDKKEKEKFICSTKDKQFFCETHYLRYQYFCPFCEKNLCHKCKDFHVHINCRSLFDCEHIKKFRIISWNSYNDDVVKNLNKLYKIIGYTYYQGLNHQKLSLNLIENFCLIDNMNKFLENYIKVKAIHKQKVLTSHLFKNEQEDNYLCEYFYDEEFQKQYSTLIEKAEEGKYEYHHNLQVIQQFYEIKKRYKTFPHFKDNTFINSLKGQISHFKYIFHILSENLIKINTQIQINYLNQEIENLKAQVGTLDLNIHLLKQINVNLLHTNNYKLRRKIGNLILEEILLNYQDQLASINPNEYILYESQIQLKKKIKETKDLIGPQEAIKNYKDNLIKHYESLLKMANSQISSKLKNLKKENTEIFDEDDIQIQINPKNNNDLNEVICLNLFFILKKKYGKILNDSVHNRTENVNKQIMEEIEKLNDNESFSKESNNKELNNKELKDKQNDENRINLNSIADKSKKCLIHFKILGELQNHFNIKKKTLLEKDNNMLKLVIAPKITKENKDDFRSQLNELFKNYQYESDINFKNSSQLYFNGKIIDILKEKKIYENLNKLKEEIQKVDLENEKKEIENQIQEIEPIIKKIIKFCENLKIKLYGIIRKNQKYFNLEENNKIRGELKNPFETLDNIEDIDLDEISNDKIKDIYLTYLINLYFCAEDEYEFLFTLSKNYSDTKMIDTLKRNTEKRELLKIFDSKIKYEEPDIFKLVWSELKKEDYFIENNDELNKKLKNYVILNDEKNL